MALDKKIRNKGSDSNNGRISIIFLEKNFSTQKKLKIITPRKAPKKIKQEDAPKNKLISFLKIASILSNGGQPSFHRTIKNILQPP